MPRVHPAVREHVVVRRAIVMEDVRKVRLKERHFSSVGGSSSFACDMTYSKRGDLAAVRARAEFDDTNKMSMAAANLCEECPNLLSYSLLSTIKAEAAKLAGSPASLMLQIIYDRQTGTVTALITY